MPRDKNTDAASLPDADDLEKLSLAEYEFVRLLVHEGKTASEAFRLSHPDAKAMSDSAIWSKASRLRGSARIQEWETALLQWGMHRGQLTQDEFVRDMEALARRAEAAGNYGAAVNAKANAGKVAGLYVDRYEDMTKREDSREIVERARKMYGDAFAEDVALRLGLHTTH